MTNKGTVRFFKDSPAFRAWLEKNHTRALELQIGFYKVKSGRGGITYKQALDEALCFGWIDGRLNRIDDERHTIRFTPRRSGSHWSRINIARAKQLQAEGRMTPAGLVAFERRDEGKTINYSYELRAAKLPPALRKRFQARGEAWAYFQAQAPSYQRHATFWVMDAKREETRLKRFEILFALSASKERLDMLKSNAPRVADVAGSPGSRASGRKKR